MAAARIADVCRVFEQIAPLSLAQDWDNVGLLAGDENAACATVLLAIDLTAAVLDEAEAGGAELIMAYHPPLFRPIKALRAAGSGTEALVWRAINRGIAIYSMHTALDAAAGGTNDVLAEMCGATDTTPFEFIDDVSREYKLVTFVPAESTEGVAEALAQAGAGVIGHYTRCSFRIPGTGTFFGGEGSAPVIGQPGQYETVQEVRLEMVVPPPRLAQVVEALRRSHPYEEPAFDIYPLQPRPRPGIGRIGRLSEPINLEALGKRLQAAAGAAHLQIVGDRRARVERAAVCAGAAGSLPAGLPLGPTDCVVTGELRHHEALSIRRRGASAIVLGHWASERPVLRPLAGRISASLPGITARVSQADADPFIRDLTP